MTRRSSGFWRRVSEKNRQLASARSSNVGSARIFWTGPARDLVEDALGDPQEQLLLGAEVPEDGALRDAHLLGQQVERRALDAAAREESHGGLEDRLLGAHAALLTRAALGALGRLDAAGRVA